METKQRLGMAHQTITCHNCMEEYSTTYKRCPFCSAKPPKGAKHSLFVEEPTLGRGALEQTQTHLPPIEDAPPPVVTPEDVEFEPDSRAFDVEPELDEDPYLPKPGYKGGKRLDRSRRGRVLIPLLLSLIIVGAAGYIVWTEFGDTITQRWFPDGVSISAITSLFDGDESADTPAIPEETAPPPPTPMPEPEPEPPTLSLSDTRVTLDREDATKQLSVTTTGEDRVGTVQWSSSNETVATVDLDGLVTAVLPGVAIITASVGEEVTLICEITCIWDVTIPIENLSLNKEDFTLNPGGRFTMQVIGTDATVVWTSDNPSVASVSEEGIVTHISTGTTNITASVGGQKLSCIVRCS